MTAILRLAVTPTVTIQRSQATMTPARKRKCTAADKAVDKGAKRTSSINAPRPDVDADLHVEGLDDYGDDDDGDDATIAVPTTMLERTNASASAFSRTLIPCVPCTLPSLFATHSRARAGAGAAGAARTGGLAYVNAMTNARPPTPLPDVPDATDFSGTPSLYRAVDQTTDTQTEGQAHTR